MPYLLRLKILSSISGLVLGLFLIAHMTGNLKYFGGAEAIDTYAIFLREVGKELLGKETALWMFRFILLAALIVHVSSTVLLYKASSRSKANYLTVHREYTSLASRNMVLLGILVVIFVVFHILHLTLGVIHPDGFKHLSVYNNVTLSFSRLSYVVAYLAGVGAVCLHFSAGARSLAQSLGLAEATNLTVRKVAQALALILFIGFMSVPIIVFVRSVYAG